LFEPLIALNLLMIGFIFVGRRRERQAILRGRAVTGATSIACPWRIRNYAAIGIWNRPRQWYRQA
jgi:hypothetical protein